MARERTTEGTKGQGSEQGREDPRPRDLASRSSSAPAREDFGDPFAMGMASPFALVRRFMEDLDGLFESFGGSPGTSARGGAVGRQAQGAKTWMPVVEVFEREGQLVVRAEVPGVTKDQISIECEDDRLTLSGERSEEQEQRERGFYRSERMYGRFHRTIALPEGADSEQAKATFNNGILEITMPLQRPAETSRRIEIQEAEASGQPGGEGEQTTH